jgi:hypothetical protein
MKFLEKILNLFKSKEQKDGDLWETDYKKKEADRKQFYNSINSKMIYNMTDNEKEEYPPISVSYPRQDESFNKAINDAINYHNLKPERKTIITCDIVYTTRIVPEE